MSIEIYVILTFVAAAVIAIAAMPTRRGEARQYLLAGALHHEAGADPAPTAAIDIVCNDDGTVTLRRTGLGSRVNPDGAVSLACTLVGFDLNIEERLTPGAGRVIAPMPDQAIFTLDFLARDERYHVKYNSEAISAMTAFTLSNRPGLHITRNLNS